MDIEKIIQSMTTEEKASMLSGKDFWQSQNIERLGIPSIFLADGPHGIRKQAAAADHLGLNPSLKSTCFPSAATLANSWDTSLAQMVGAAIGAEATRQNVHVVLGPGVNIKRNPLCGRNFEYYSEDPYLAGKMGSACIRGIQSQGSAACVKHFAANNQEENRMTIDAHIDERALREIYLTAFEMAVREGEVQTVMSSYNRLNGTYANENPHLLVDILRKEWQFDGVVVTDWGGNNDRVAALQCYNELEMPSCGGETSREIVRAVQNGQIDEKLLDENVRRLLKLVLFTHQNLQNNRKMLDFSESEQQIENEQHHSLACHAAEAGIVLLKNEGSVLPIPPKARVAVIGDFAQKARYQGSGSSVVNPTQLDDALLMIEKTEWIQVGYTPGFKRFGKKSKALQQKAVQLAQNADTVLLFLGLDENTETEGLDRKTIRLPQNQIDLIEAIKQTHKKVVVVLSLGSVVEMDWIDDVDALVYSGLGGQAVAGAVLNVLTGKTNPCGKLSETIAHCYADCPSASNFPGANACVEYRESLFVGYRYYDTANIAVRFPFGYGLSYTQFDYSALQIEADGVTLTLCNTGKKDGSEIVQLYIGAEDSQIFRPKKELKGFVKVFLRAGERRKVKIPFDTYTFRYYDVCKSDWQVEPCVYTVSVGASVADIRLTGQIDKTQADTAYHSPYVGKVLPSYFSGQAANVSAEEFAALYGQSALSAANSVVKKNRILINVNTAIRDLRYSKGWTGRFFARLLRFADKFLRFFGKTNTANMLHLGVFNMPLRGLSRMSGGAISWGQLDGLMIMFNGKFFAGLKKFVREGHLRKKRIKAEKRNKVSA